MTDYVIDAIVLMSILISGKSIYKPLLDYYNFILPEFALAEIDKYKLSIFEQTLMKKTELLNFSCFVFSKVTILPNYIMDEQIFENALKLTKYIDIKDTSYIALSMQLNITLLTRDKKLIAGANKKNYKKIQLFDEFLRKI